MPIENASRQAQKLVAEAYTHLNSGKSNQAQQVLLKVVDLCAEIPDEYIKVRILNDLGIMEARLKKYDDAVLRFQEALRFFKIQGNAQGEAKQWGNIGSVHRDKQEWNFALESYSRALTLYQELEYDEGIADQHTNIAYIYVMSGELNAALEKYKRALSLYRAINNKDKANFTKQNILNLQTRIGRCCR